MFRVANRTERPLAIAGGPAVVIGAATPVRQSTLCSIASRLHARVLFVGELTQLPVGASGADLALVDTESAPIGPDRLVESLAPITVVMIGPDDATEVVATLEAGVAAHLASSESLEVIAARIAAVLRRIESNRPTPTVDLWVDVDHGTAERGDRVVRLSPMQARLCAGLARHAGQAMTRDDLLREVWGTDYLGGSRLVDMAVARLRDPLRELDAEISTVRGHGYRLDLS